MDRITDNRSQVLPTGTFPELSLRSELFSQLHQSPVFNIVHWSQKCATIVLSSFVPGKNHESAELNDARHKAFDHASHARLYLLSKAMNKLLCATLTILRLSMPGRLKRWAVTEST